jgi:WD40 repeat protein
LAYSPDGKLLVAGLDPWGPIRAYVKIWDAQDGDLIHTMQEHTGPVWTLGFDGEGKNLASGAEDATVKVWNPLTGAVRRSFAAPMRGISPCVAYAPQGRTLTVTHAGRIHFWEPLSGVPMASALKAEGDVYDLAYSADGKLLATTSGRVQVWDVAKGRLVATLGENALRVAFAPDGKVLAMGDRNGRVTLWDIRRYQVPP